MENLPPELLDEIIGYLPQDKRLLRNYSLVARSWTYPCQSRLLETIERLFESTLWQRLDKTSPGNVEVLHCVRSLYLYIDVSLRERSEALAHFHHNEFPLFPRLRHMVLHYCRRPLVSPQLGVALAPQNTLEYLSLRDCRVTISALVALINHFPNLAEVQLISLIHEVNHEPTTSFTRPLVKLSIVHPDTDNDPSIIGQFLEMQPRCDEVTIGTNLGTLPSQTRLLLIQRVIDGVLTTIKRLNLKFLTKREWRPKALPGEWSNRMLKFYFRSEEAFYTRKIPRALRASDPLFEFHGAPNHLDDHLLAYAKDYVH